MRGEGREGVFVGNEEPARKNKKRHTDEGTERESRMREKVCVCVCVLEKGPATD